MPALESQLILENTHLWQKESISSRDNPVIQRIGSGELLRIMGPCALQSTEQVEDMLHIIGHDADVVRAPGKKPRTRPVSPKGERMFEGIGLDKAKAIYHEIMSRFPQTVFASEVMSGSDIITLGESIGLGWIGSRTQQQETCRDVGTAAQQLELPIMIKNPMSADLELFLGMIENTILGSENTVPLLICLRGTVPVNDEQRSEWRNVPNLHWLPILLEAFPQLPIIIDPSHMLKKNTLTPEKIGDIVSQAKDQGARGYIIEVNTPAHPSLTDPGVNAEEMMNVLAQKNLS